MLQAVLRFYSYALHLLVSLALLATGAVAALSSNATFEIDFFPWSGKELQNWLIGLGLLGILFTVLAYKGTMKFLFLAWTVIVTGFAVYGIFLSGHRFDGETDFWWALGFLAAVALTICGGLSRARMR